MPLQKIICNIIQAHVQLAIMNEIKADLIESPQRLMCIDALRGFDMFWIIGGGLIFKQIHKVWPDNVVMGVVNDQLHHVNWQGFHCYDLIFPLFMFIMGVVLPYSFASRRRRGQTNTQILYHILKRSFILIVLGLIFQGVMNFDWSNLRWSAVLTLIGGSYCIAAMILLYTSLRTQIIIFVGILLGYWAILALVEVQTVKNGVTMVYGGGDYSMKNCLIAYLDQRFIPGKHPYGNATNGVGPFLSFTGACTVMLGGFAGQWLRSKKSQDKKLLGLIVAGLVCLGIGYLWNLTFPIIKLMWSSSFVLVAGGYSLLLLAMFYGVIDIGKFSRWAFPFVVIGVNPITIYLLQHIIDFSKPANFLLGGIAKSCGAVEPIILVAGTFLVKWGFLYWLYRKKIFIKF